MDALGVNGRTKDFSANGPNTVVDEMTNSRALMVSRLVFAHYMVTNQDYQGNTDPTQEAKIAACEREIQQAQAAGIDGFALNVGGWK